MKKDLLNDLFGRFREIPFELAKRNNCVIGLCLSYANKKEGLFLDGQVSWRSINATFLKLPGLFRFIKIAQSYAKQSDVIWTCSDSFYGVIGCVIGKICKVPVIFDIYDNFDEFFVAKLPITKQLYHWAIRQSDAITCLSSSFAIFIGKKYKRTHHVYPIEFAVRNDLFKPLNKNHCRRMLNLPPDAFLIGTAGGLFRNRDVHLLIDAFVQLREKYPNMQLALAGPLDRNLLIPNDDRTHYLGVLPFNRVPYFMNSLDIAVVCYADDNFGKYCFPQKTREFMACDIPVVAARVGSLKELFQDHPEWLYEPANVQSLVQVLENRIYDRKTDYTAPPTWGDLAQILEKIILQIQNEKKKRIPA